MLVQNGAEQPTSQSPPNQSSQQQQQQQQQQAQSQQHQQQYQQYQIPPQPQYQSYHSGASSPPSHQQGLSVPDTTGRRQSDDASSQGHSSVSSSVGDRNPFRQLKNKNSNSRVDGNDSLGVGNDKNERPLSIFNPTVQDLAQSHTPEDPSLPTPPVPPPPPNASSNLQYFPDPNLAHKVSQLSVSSGSPPGLELADTRYSPQYIGTPSSGPVPIPVGSLSASPSNTNTNPYRGSPSHSEKMNVYGDHDDNELLPGLPAKPASPNALTPSPSEPATMVSSPPLPPKTSLPPSPMERVYTPDSVASEQAAAEAAKQKDARKYETEAAAATSSTPEPSSSQRPTSPPGIPQETYMIKHIRYLEPMSNKIRKGAVLMQNENGPCPLIALVNVLSLSRECLVLGEALRVREQLSLELLLQVVCEELVLAGNWAGDLTELFMFLMDLRKGMNINPQFVGDDVKTEDYMHDDENVPANRPAPLVQPGSFVQTRDVELYNAFAVPMVHGWLPSPNSPFFPSLVRHARDYERAQDLVVQQQFILEKHSRPDSEDVMSVEDSEIVSRAYEVQEFLDDSATQLTAYGIDVLSKKLQPGEYCIFFRNEHFSTLYKHAKTGVLYTLATDAGYATYEEIVWESLVDGTGRGGSHFSGDFRPVGDHGSEIREQQQALARRQQQHQQQQAGTASAENDWQVVQNNRRHAHRMRNNGGNNGNNGGNNNNSTSIDERVFSGSRNDVGLDLPPRRSSLNQTTVIPGDGTDTTDFDLALAIHLQQEEDERANLERRSADTTNYRSMIPGNGNGNGNGGGGGGGSGSGNGNRRSTGYRPPQPPRTAASAQAAAAVQQQQQPSAPTGDPSIDDPPPLYERVDSHTVGPNSPDGFPAPPHQRSSSSALLGGSGAGGYHNPSAGTHQSGHSAYAQMSGYTGQHRRRASQGAYVPPSGPQDQGKDKCILM